MCAKVVHSVGVILMKDDAKPLISYVDARRCLVLEIVDCADQGSVFVSSGGHSGCRVGWSTLSLWGQLGGNQALHVTCVGDEEAMQTVEAHA